MDKQDKTSDVNSPVKWEADYERKEELFIFQKDA